jgi:hypothetical protein
MKYFNHVATLEELKSEFRRLALENHPDRGGSVEAMQEINAEFEVAFLVMKKRGTGSGSFWAGFEPNESAASFRRKFYTENGWAGSRYNPNIRLRDLAPIVRGYVKDVYPTWKFSVVQEHSSWVGSLHVSLMEAPEKIFVDEEYARERGGRTDGGYLQNWDWYYGGMSDRAREVLNDVVELVESFRFDDSDARFDYFDTNFYTHFNIGKWDRPLKIVPKRERIQTSQGPVGAKRITG